MIKITKANLIEVVKAELDARKKMATRKSDLLIKCSNGDKLDALTYEELGELLSLL